MAIAPPLPTPSTARLYTVTASDADKYAECGLAYWSAKQQDTSDADPDRFSHGNASHAVLKGVNKLLTAGRSFPSPELALERLWNPSFFRDPEREVQGRSALPAGLEHYRRYLDEQGLTVLSAEQFLATPAKVVSPEIQVRVKGKIDVMARRNRDNALVVLDFKTALGLPCPEDLASKPSSTIYCCLGKRLYPGAALTLIAQLSVASGLAVTTDLTSDQLEASRHIIYRMASALHEAETSGSAAFEATPGDHCTWCPFQDICPVFLAMEGDDEEFVL